MGVSRIRTDIFASLELSVLLAGQDTEGVGTEVVTLRLDEVGRDDLAAVAVEEGEGSGESGERNTPDDALSNDTPPTRLSLVEGLVEEVVEQEGFETLVLGVGSGDVAEEDGLDNATTTPHLSNASIVEVPALLLGSLTHEHEALRVRDDLGGVESLLEIIDELLLVTLECLLLWTSNDTTGANALFLDGGQATREDGLTNESD